MLVLITFVAHAPLRLLVVDYVLYRTQASYCTGTRHRFSCDENHVIWVGNGVNWGVKPFGTPDESKCNTSPFDCIMNNQKSPFIEVRFIRDGAIVGKTGLF